MRGFLKSPAGLITVGLLVGLLLSPVAAQAGGGISKLFKQLKPKMDARYVQSGEEAYAFVDALAIGGPVLRTARTKNFASVSHPEIGLYCLTPAAKIDLDGRIILATPEYSRSSGVRVDIMWTDPGDNSICPDGTVEIQTFQTDVVTDDFSFSVFLPST